MRRFKGTHAGQDVPVCLQRHVSMYLYILYVYTTIHTLVYALTYTHTYMDVCTESNVSICKQVAGQASTERSAGCADTERSQMSAAP